MEEIKIAYVAALSENMGEKVSAIELQNELQKSKKCKVYISSNGYNIFFEDTKNYYTYENGENFKTEIVDFEDIKVGDYIDYPVYFDNVTLGDKEISNDYNGWRVLEKVSEEGENYIKIIPTGVPLSITYNSTGNTLRNIWDYPYMFSNYSSYKNIIDIEESTFKDFSNNYMEYLYDLKNLFVNNVYTKKDEEFNPCVEFLNKKDIEKLLQTTITDTISITDNDLLAISMESGYANIIIQDNDTNEIWCIDSEGNLKALTDTGIYGTLPVVTLKSNIMFSKSNEKLNDNTVYDISIDESEEQFPENYVLYANFETSSKKLRADANFRIITNANTNIQVLDYKEREITLKNLKTIKYKNDFIVKEFSFKLTNGGNSKFTINLLDEDGEIIYTTTKTIMVTRL